jgi:hypothetical protein
MNLRQHDQMLGLGKDFAAAIGVYAFVIPSRLLLALPLGALHGLGIVGLVLIAALLVA